MSVAPHTVRLDQPSTLPVALQERVATLRPIFKRHQWMDNVIETGVGSAVAAELESWLSGQRISGYHCTKEPRPGYYAEKGLRVLNLRDHIDEFLQAHAARMRSQLLKGFQDHYAWWTKSDKGHREGMIWFCMSWHLVVNDGTDRFFKYFGGEALYWPFDDRTEDGQQYLRFLESIGRGVVVEVAIPGQDLIYYKEFGLARDVLSHAARAVNPEFQIDPLEGHLTRNVLPDEVIAVHEAPCQEPG